MEKHEDVILHKLRDTAKLVVPEDGEVWLYGSRARGDAHKDSDWDLLILLNQPSITTEDEENIAYPFVVEGWKNDAACPVGLRACMAKKQTGMSQMTARLDR